DGRRRARVGRHVIGAAGRRGLTGLRCVPAGHEWGRGPRADTGSAHSALSPCTTALVVSSGRISVRLAYTPRVPGPLGEPEVPAEHRCGPPSNERLCTPTTSAPPRYRGTPGKHTRAYTRTDVCAARQL